MTFHLENNFKIKTINTKLPFRPPDDRLTFYLKNEKKTGTSYWKLNSCILENNEYQNKITSFWQKWHQIKQNCQNPTIWWDNGKKFIRGITEDFCTKLKETEKKHLH